VNSDKYTIAIVEDELSLQELIQINLESEGYQVKVYSKGDDAINDMANLIRFDLIILDVMLPNVSGLDICEAIRESSMTPILFLSAKGTTADRIQGLKKGGSDYLVKPFDLEELLLKIQILLKSFAQNDKNSAEIGGKTVDFKTYEVSDKGEVITTLTKKEIDLLKLFYENEGLVISRNEILDKVWGYNHYPTTRTVDNFILTFRKLFESNSKSPNHFLSIRGVGYKFIK
tara:strand:- start:562 stop:1251 length:690 start_codon:yes stop_codon:yes gene_type:complete